VFLTDGNGAWIFSAARFVSRWNKRRSPEFLKLINPKSAAASCRRKSLQALMAARGSYQIEKSSEPRRNRAEALFKKEEARRDSNRAMAEYHANQLAMRQKMARSRALRLARKEVNKKQPFPPQQSIPPSPGDAAFVSRGADISFATTSRLQTRWG
jgi:hypothetical protein